MAEFWLISPPGNKDARFQLASPGPISIGREISCGIVLADRAVSRQHATLSWTPPTTQEPGSWRLEDLGSSGGTVVNGMRLSPGKALPLQHGDQIQIAPWNFDVIDQQSSINGARTIVMSGAKEQQQEGTQIERVTISAPATFAQNQLVLLLQSNEAIHKAKDESAVYEALVNAVSKSTRFENVAFVRSTGQGEAVDVLAQVGDIQDPSGKTRMSRTMLRQAREGPVVAKANATGGGIAMSLQGMDVRRAICIPVEFAGALFGFLYLDDSQQRDDAMLAETASVAGAVARMAALSLGNQQRAHMEQRVHMEKQLMFEGFTHSLILTIDAKDPYTRGHSERVAIYAKMLAEAANLGPEMMELAYRCGRVHDIGKINVPGDLLRKPSRLTAEEFAQITVHPEASYKILHPIPQMRDVLPGVLEHHEKWDGSGYPNKLVGEKISVLGRIIGIADCFDAMTSSRAYRPAREIGEVLVEIEKCLGKHFDPELGKVFLSIPVHKLLEHIVTASPAQAEQKSI